MLLNCTRVKHVYTTLQVTQIPRDGPRLLINAISRSGPYNGNVLQLLQRRSYQHLYNIRPPAAPYVGGAGLGGTTAGAGANCRWTGRLLNIRGGNNLSMRSRRNNSDFKTQAEAEAKPNKRTKPKLGDYKRLFSLIKLEKKALILGIGCLFISSAITMSVPYFMGKVIDVVFDKEGITQQALSKLKEHSMILFVMFAIGGLANFARVYLFGSASLRIVRHLRSRLYRSILLQEASWFDAKGTGELINRLSNDTFFVGSSLSQNVSDGLRSLAMISVGSGMMIYTSPKLALVSALVVPALASIAIFYGRYVRSITRTELDKYAEIMKHAEERFGNVKTVKVFSREEKEVEDFNTYLNSALDIGYRETYARSLFFGSTGFTGNCIIISVLYYGGLLVVSNELTMGAMTAFMLYAGYVAISMNGLSNFYSQLNKGIGASERIWEIFDRETAIPLNKGVVPLNKPVGAVEFRNLNFCYPSRSDYKLFSDFNLKLAPHQTTAVVGRSGSGKSTLAMLLVRLFDPQSGGVYLDGVDLRELNPQWLRSHIGVVSQEPVLFSGTIRSNILFGVGPGGDDSEARLQQVLEDANLQEFVKKLPDGLETLVGQGGMLLSGGQKQRVAIARAIIRNPTILVLDEATSALDSVSETQVQQALDKLIKGRTVLTISHRLSTIHDADKIAVLDQGRVVEEGTYDELMLIHNGAFRELVSKQAFASTS